VKSERPLVVAVGPFPPPTHGAARVTDAFVRSLASHVEVRRVDTGGDGRTGVAYHVARVLAHARALMALLSINRRRRRSIYVGGAGGLGLWYQVITVAGARAMRFRIAYHHHSYAYLNAHSTAMQLLVYLAGPRACHVVLCDDMAIAFRQGYSRAPEPLVISNALLVLDTQSSPSSPRAPSRMRLIHLSNLSIDKGLGRAVESLRAALNAGLDVELLLGGPLAGPDEATLLRDGAREFGTRLRHVGALANEDVPAFLAGADLFVFPSLYRNEAEPLVVLEAMAAGLPVLAYAVGCASCMLPSALPPLEISLDFGPRVVSLLRELADCEVAGKLHAESREQLSHMRLHAKNQASQLAEWLAWEADTYDYPS